MFQAAEHFYCSIYCYRIRLRRKSNWEVDQLKFYLTSITQLELKFFDTYAVGKLENLISIESRT